jgi:hypothetical protein
MAARSSPDGCPRCSREHCLRLASHDSRHKELGKLMSANDGASSNPPQACKDNVISLGLQYIPSVLNIWVTQTRCVRLDAHPSCGCRYLKTYPKYRLVSGLRAQGNCHSQILSLLLTDWHRHPRPGRFPNDTHGWPDFKVIEYGDHTRHPDARPSGNGTPTPLSGPVRGRGGHSRLACSSLVSPRTSGSRRYGPPRGRHLAPGPSHGKSPILGAVRVDGKTPRLPFPAPGVLRHQGYAARVTRFGRSPDGCSAAHLLASKLAAATSRLWL